MNEENYIGIEIKSLSNTIHRRMDGCAALAGTSLTGIQGFVLMYLGEREEAGPVFQRDLEKVLRVRRSTVTEIVQTMERNGLVTRTAVCSDGRMKAISLTDSSRLLRLEMVRQLELLETQMRRGIPREELAAFFATIKKIRHNIELSEVNAVDNKNS